MMKEWIKFIKFGLVGILNTAIDFLVFNLFLFFGCPPTASKAFSYTAGMVNSFFFNKNWTFQVKGDGRKQFISFLLLNLATLAVSVGLMKGFTPFLARLDFLTDYPLLSNNLANLIVIAITMILNFIGSKAFVFYHK